MRTTKAATADYIKALSHELMMLARGYGLGLLAYVLSMAKLQASKDAKKRRLRRS